MQTPGRSLVTAAAIICLTATLTGCPKPNVGSTSNESPVAVAGPDQTVRSQTDVTLSGRDSFDNDGVIQTYKWEQVSGPQVTLSKATNSTLKFAVPEIFSATDFVFKLTVTDDKGATSTSQVTITADPPVDPDRFLTLVEVPGTFKVVAASTSSAGTADQPFSIDVATTIGYNVYVDGVADARTKTITQSASGSWPSAGSGGQSKDDYRNPWYTFDLPKVNLQDIVAELSDNERLYPTARNNLTVTTTVTLSAGGISTYLYVLDQGGSIIDQTAGSPDATLSFKSSDATLDALFSQKTPQGADITDEENEATAKAYYAAIDPGNDKDTLTKWKAANGFVDDDPNTVEATYINGFDLGFARHMYMRKDDNGNVYSYVINAPNFDSADSNVNTIATVAMEYSPAPGAPLSDPDKYTKFYTFVLNPITGEQDRAITMDFDGRGEKYQPGTCLQCHGGKPAALSGGVYPNNGDLRNAASGSKSPGFLPWDVSTLYFSDDDFDNHTRLTPPSAAQLDAFRRFNEMVLLTDPSDTVKTLIHGWYGVTDTSATTIPADATFNGDFIPDGWLPGNTGGPSDADADKASTLYLQVVGPYCRACHAQRTEKSAISFSTYADFMGYASEGIGGIPNRVFDMGVMPLARHTMDEFWRSATAASPASVLASQLGLADTRMPGTPIALIDRAVVGGSSTTIATGTVDVDITGGSVTVRPNGDSSYFAKTLQWTLTSKPAGSSAVLVGDTTPDPAFVADVDGDYVVQLVVNNGETDSDPASITVTATTSPPPPPTVTFTEVNNTIFTNGGSFSSSSNYCISCHNSGAHTLNFTTSPSNNYTQAKNYVDDSNLPTSASNSQLLQKPSSGSHGVRPGFDTSSGGDHSNYDKVLQWIQQGALNN